MNSSDRGSTIGTLRDQEVLARYSEHYLKEGEAYFITRQTFAPGTRTQPHKQDYFEFFRVISGQVTHWVNGQGVPVEQHELVFVRPDDTHAFEVADEDSFELVNTLVRSSLIFDLAERHGKELAGSFFWSDAVVPFSLVLSQSQLARHSLREDRLQNGAGSSLRIEAALLDLICDLGERDSDGVSGAPGWLVSAISEMDDPEVLREGAAGLVALTGRSHEHVCRSMRRHLGSSPTEYVNRRRMQVAADRLAGSDTPIPQIAFDCGLENLSHFYSLFRREYAQTPAAYRRKHRMAIA